MLTGPDVQRIRKAKNLSQQELAFRSGVNKAYISEYESGIRRDIHERGRKSCGVRALAYDFHAGAAGRVFPDQPPRQHFVVGHDEANPIKHRGRPLAGRVWPRTRRRPAPP